MAGETDLKQLLRSMRPQLDANRYVFATLPLGQPMPDNLQPVMTFHEDEGTTLVLRAEEAEAAGLAGAFACRRITLMVHSSLEAVGFLAAITARLAKAGMGVNPVSAFFHDHLFVPAERAGEAMAMLEALARENG